MVFFAAVACAQAKYVETRGTTGNGKSTTTASGLVAEYEAEAAAAEETEIGASARARPGNLGRGRTFRVKEGKLEAGNENIGNVRYASTYKARLDQTPKDGSKGEWTGERGESTYKSTDTKANEILKKDGVNGVKYKDAIPDFSPVSKGEVKIDGMTNNRQKNFDKADAALAKEKGLTPKEIKRWREENELTWHECNDMQTMQAVPTEINSTFGHLGGVGEINAAAKEP